MQKNKKPSITFYSYDSLGNPWVGGGGAVRDFEIAKRLQAHADVTMIVGRFPGFKPGVREGVRVIGLGLGRWNNWFCRVSYAVCANFRVLLDRGDVIGNSVSTYAPILCELILRRRVYLVVHTQVGTRAFRRHGPMGFFPFFYEQLFFRFGVHYYTVNGFLKELIEKVNPKADIRVTCNGIENDLLDLRPLTPSRPFILFLGRFDVFQKGLDFLIPAYCKTGPALGVDLVLAGRGSSEDYAQIHALIPDAFRDRVHIETGMSKERKNELYASCLFFAYTSRFEGFPLAPMEANASGKAVLCMDAEGFQGCLVFGKTALAVELGNVDALQTEMRRLIESQKLREELGQNGRDHARNFTWDKIADREWGWIQETFLKG